MKDILCWWSAGATSAVAIKLAIEKYGKERCRIIYFKIGTAHQDNKRFIQDCEKWYGLEIEQHSSLKYEDQFDVIENTKYVNGAKGARCTMELKRLVRERLQKEINWTKQIFGFEFTKKEIERSKRIPIELNAEFPLIESKITKPNCLGILKESNIEIPFMYKLGYPNNNCIGCVKGGAGYWNKIKIDFPEIFNKMATLERKVGRTCLKEKDGSRIYLDELKNTKGRKLKPVVADCGFFCGDTKEYI